MISRSKCLWTSLLLSFCLCSAALAQSRSGGDAPGADDEGRVHFQRGVELYREGSYSGALVEFERFYQLTGNYKILYNIAQVQAQRHEYVKAIARFNEYLQQGGDEIPADRKQAVRQDVLSLSSRTAELEVTINVDDASLFVNGQLYGTSPLAEPVLVNVGTVQLRVEKPGCLPLERTLSVVGGEHTRLALNLLSEPSSVNLSQSQPPPQRQADPTYDYTAFWIGLSTTAALGAVTATVGGLTLSARSLLDDRLSEYPGNANAVESARDKLRLRAMLTDGFGVATLLAAGTTLYFLLDPPKASADKQPKAELTAFGLVPGGLQMLGTF